MEECQKLWDLVHELNRMGVAEPRYILFQLFVDNALEFSAVSDDHSVLMSRSLRPNQTRLAQVTEEFVPAGESFSSLLEEHDLLSADGLNQLAMLQGKYNETKEVLQPQLQMQLCQPDEPIDWRLKLTEICTAGPSPTFNTFVQTPKSTRKIKKKENL